ncbi:MAG: ribonuclease III [Bacteroidetes bacterium]|nr:ribonuclease III [Bacteroidota bacterium]
MVLSRFRHFVSSLFGTFSRRSAEEQKLHTLYSRIDWNLLESAMQYSVRNKDYFVRALVHRSFIPISHVEALESNERMEFLGDSILNFVVAEYLFRQYPEKEEGELTILRARLVNRKALAFCAKEIDLKQFMLTHTNSAGVQEKGFDTILADAYEAIIAALFLDNGMAVAKNFILTRLTSALANGYLKVSDQNYKSELLELSQAQGTGIPRYQTLKEEGPDHDRTFTIQVLISNEAMGTGVGKNKKEAEQAAAEEAVAKLQKV